MTDETHAHEHIHGQGHGHGHGHGTSDLTEHEVRELFEPASWDQRYAAGGAVFSRNPNRQVVVETEGLTPGTALDVGCGEGGDAVWLAGQGWQVTGTDFSAVALARCAALAAERGVADRTEWRLADARTWQADGEQWDLVSSQFIHLPDGGMPDLVRRLAAAVAPGGTLLVVGHHPRDRESGLRWSVDDILSEPEDLLPGLDGSGAGAEAWDVRTEVRTREERGPDGEPLTVRDSVLVARRPVAD
jgi:SAM-dependent methyltransferase